MIDSNIEKQRFFKVTKEHFVIFKKEALKFQSMLGLFDWELFFVHEETDARADITYNIQGRCATVRLGLSWALCKPTSEEISKTALHEILHLLIADYQDLIIDNSTTTTAKLNQIGTLDHIIIRKLEHLVFDVLLDKTSIKKGRT